MLTLDAQLFPEADPAGTVDAVRFLEANGFHAAWVGDSPPLGWAEVYVTLALCSQATSRILLGPGVTNPVTRHASVTAAAMLTIDRLSNGRAELGLGLGYSAVRALGLQPARLTELEAYVAEVRRVFAKQGRTIRIYVAASGPRSLIAAGRFGDGAMVSVGTHPALVRRALEHIRRGAEEAGRDPNAVEAIFQAGLGIGPDADERVREAAPITARKALDVHKHPEFFDVPELRHLHADADAVARAYDVNRHTDPEAPHNKAVSAALVDAFTLVGTPEECLERLRAMEKAGATRVALSPWGRDRRGALELFAREVLPKL
jgi:5,10-methylenetetrahydromethanopterin reductase